MRTVVLILFGLLPATAGAQSFNCRYARQPDEVTICEDRRLSQLDERLSARFYRLKNRLDGRELDRLERTQAIWLSRRSRCGSDADCIEEAYVSRLDRLSEW
jgi:uncharacterized protein